MMYSSPHNIVERDKLLESILDILAKSPGSLAHREIGGHLRTKFKRIPDYEVINSLRILLKNGQVNFTSGKWSNQNKIANTPPQEKTRASISLSPESIVRLGLTQSDSFKTFTDIEVETSGCDRVLAEEDLLQNGTWSMFRKLIAYYKQCIRNEECADASAYQNEFGHKYVYLRKTGSWYPRHGLLWRTCLALGPHLSQMLNSLSNYADDQTMVVGYPVHAFYIEKENEPSISVIRPVFYFNVDTTISRDGLIVSSESPQVEVNLGWLDYAFSKNLDRQRSFLSACGFINRSRPVDEAPGLERGEISPNMDNLASALAAFIPDKINQPLEIDHVDDAIIKEPFKTGIYNRAVLMKARKTKFQATLLKELSAIEKFPDEVLDQTALRHVFTRDSNASPSDSNPYCHESVVMDINQLNAEQRRATAAILENNITVITGPPGTGKSQVVSCASINARIKNLSVLFASRNHKAIDAVIGRLVDINGRALMIRTNSKDDPNLNFTFSHAIKDMLAAQRDPFAIEKLERLKDELEKLLEERGRQAAYSRQTAEVSVEIGNLEEKMSYLANGMPEELTANIDKAFKCLPAKAILKIVEIAHSLNLDTPNGGIPHKLKRLLKIISILPAYRKARHKLHNIPCVPRLFFIPTIKGLKNLLPELPVLEKAAKYAELREMSIPLEEKIKGFPPMEVTIGAVENLSKQIAQAASGAAALDLDSRRGLRQEDDREQLYGLKSAIKALRTGLDQDAMRAETIRVLAAQAPNVLRAFPCWAVTNLSVGSRIPLVPGMFDIAIVDEASQSDIPSAIPILFRARRAAVVGDPFQLTHSSKMSTAKDTILRRRVGLKRVEDMRFVYTESSLYDLFTGTSGIEPIFLSETYRSATDIAGYSNFSFYSGRLKIATDHSKLLFPKGMKPGIHWTNLTGTVKSSGGSGCYCPDEVTAVVGLVRTILIENNFHGTLGIVTPFRQQANRLRDALFDTDSKELYEALNRSQTHVDTAHGFQGDEKDVILFSLCSGPEMPFGSRSFLKETGNLFNVAVSRARAVLHIIGNHEWARQCGIAHIMALASTEYHQARKTFLGPWHPHESPWEKKLFDALIQEELDPYPQHPVSSRRLDLALISGEKNKKIDIEVDGDCHRNPDGTRKIDDLWRDIQLQGLGWKIMRFWTYQLREDMQNCVQKIVKEWKAND